MGEIEVTGVCAVDVWNCRSGFVCSDAYVAENAAQKQTGPDRYKDIFIGGSPRSDPHGAAETCHPSGQTSGLSECRIPSYKKPCTLAM